MRALVVHRRERPAAASRLSLYSQTGAPAAAKEMPLLDAKVLSQLFHVGHQVPRRVVLQVCMGRGTTSTSLVKEIDAVVRGVEPPLGGWVEAQSGRCQTRRASTAHSLYHLVSILRQDRHGERRLHWGGQPRRCCVSPVSCSQLTGCALFIATYFPVHFMAVVYLECARLEGINGGVQLAQGLLWGKVARCWAVVDAGLKRIHGAAGRGRLGVRSAAFAQSTFPKIAKAGSKLRNGRVGVGIGRRCHGRAEDGGREARRIQGVPLHNITSVAHVSLPAPPRTVARVFSSSSAMSTARQVVKAASRVRCTAGQGGHRGMQLTHSTLAATG